MTPAEINQEISKILQDARPHLNIKQIARDHDMHSNTLYDVFSTITAKLPRPHHCVMLDCEHLDGRRLLALRIALDTGGQISPDTIEEWMKE